MRLDLLNEQVAINTVSESATKGVFEIEGLYAGYGTPIGNALRRVLLSSLPGGAITQVKIVGANHEFSTLPGVAEDVVEIMLNLKRVRFLLHTNEPQTLTLKKKGESTVTAADIKTNADVDLITPDLFLATLTEKSSELDMELTVEKGLGYASSEMRRSEKLPIGVIALDALFSPVTGVNFTIENMRVEDRTDYNRLRLSIETDGSITPSYALREAGKILTESFAKVAAIDAMAVPASALSSGGEKTAKKKRAAKK